MSRIRSKHASAGALIRVSRIISDILLNRSQVFHHGQFADLFAHGRTYFGGVAVMHAVVDAPVCDFLHKVLDPRPTSRCALGGSACRRQGWHGPSPDLTLQHGTDGARNDAVRTRVLGMHWGVDERHP